MTLSFSEKWGDKMGELAGKPTFFLSKIWEDLECDYPEEYFEYVEAYMNKFNGQGWDIGSPFPKIHTIREDKTNRWKAGNDIHFVINNRTKDRFQFAPVVKCRRVQKIHIKIYKSIEYDMYGEYSGVETNREVWVDDFLLSKDATRELAINDGFPDTNSFFDFFDNGFKGKIIHWTDKKY